MTAVSKASAEPSGVGQPGQEPSSSRLGQEPARQGWVLLSYRVPREPSTPRIAVWRTLKRLGVAQIGDGVVALPADPRTREQLEWVAVQVDEAGGASSVWLAQLASRAAERALMERMAAARAAEYEAIAAKAVAAARSGDPERARLVRGLRGQLRQVGRRDFFPPPQREQARAVVEALAQAVPATGRPAGVPEGVMR